MSNNDEQVQGQNIDSAILIAEDDHDQRNLLIDFSMNQIKQVLEDKTLNDQQRQTLNNIQIMSVSNIASLKRAVAKNKNVILAILDCNMPDTKDSPSHDQFIKTNHKITGQHRSVDIVSGHLPNTPITIISSLNRFRRIINLYYKNKLGTEINFINKKDPSAIQKNIQHYLRQIL